VPGSAALGRWRLVAAGFDDQGLGVNVAEYRPVEFKVQVNAAEPARLEGETAHLALQADYLFGSPMAGRQWRYTATRQRTSFAPPHSDGYVTSDEAYRAELDQSALDSAVFEAEVKPHLVHETVRSELNAARSGTRGAKSRGLVSGGRAKPWRQKGTGRARQGTIRAPQFTGGGVAFPPGMRSFDVKVNRKARRAALRGALSHHAANGTLAVLDAGSFESPSTKQAKGVLEDWGKDAPVLVVAHEDEEAVVKSFRNLERVLVTVPAELEVAAVVWARALVVTESALPLVEQRAGKEASA